MLLNSKISPDNTIPETIASTINTHPDTSNNGFIPKYKETDATAAIRIWMYII